MVNNISKLCQEDKNAKFYYSSEKIMFESKTIKVLTYVIAIIPVLLSVIPFTKDAQIVFIFTMVSFGLTLVIEFAGSFISNHKEKGILLGQLYEVNITNSEFSKIQYDREMTNELNELAIRKSGRKMSKLTKYHEVYIPKEVDDKFGYLYLARIKAAKINFLMSRMKGIYYIVLIALVILFVTFAIIREETKEFLQLIIQFYPLVMPIIKNITGTNKTMKYCIKISADIDNYIATQNPSSDELARFLYYVQSLELEALMASPARYSIFKVMFSQGLKILEEGVTSRFIESLGVFSKKDINIKITDSNFKVINVKTDDPKINQNKPKIEQIDYKTSKTQRVNVISDFKTDPVIKKEDKNKKTPEIMVNKVTIKAKETNEKIPSRSTNQVNKK